MFLLIKKEYVLCFCLMITGISNAEFKETILLKTDGYKRHDKKAVLFPHAKHHDEFKTACGDCHHDENYEPMTNLKKGDSVNQCIDCHDIPKMITGKNISEQTAFHGNTLHLSCIGCHQRVNLKKSSASVAPVKCSHCHNGG